MDFTKEDVFNEATETINATDYDLKKINVLLVANMQEINKNDSMKELYIIKREAYKNYIEITIKDIDMDIIHQTDQHTDTIRHLEEGNLPTEEEINSHNKYLSDVNRIINRLETIMDITE